MIDTADRISGFCWRTGEIALWVSAYKITHWKAIYDPDEGVPCWYKQKRLQCR